MGTFLHGAKCDIYIGISAGRELMDDIFKAKKSIKLISPYLSASFVRDLIHLNSKGIDVFLITSDGSGGNESWSKENIHEMIHQTRSLDVMAQVKRDKWIGWNKKLLIGIISLCVIMALWLFNSMDLEAFVLCGIPLLIMYLIRKWLIKKVDRQRIYHYSYTQAFPFKVYMAKGDNLSLKYTSIHSKVYIIDDEIVYLGSLNFTYSGTRNNYETMIRTTDKDAVEQILQEYNNLFHDSRFAEKDIQSWGRQIYFESKN